MNEELNRMEFAFTNDDSHLLNKSFFAFTVFTDESKSLSFPLNLSFFWRLLISAFLVVILIQGTQLRFRIVSYLRSPDIKMNENNILFCLDQVNGLFLAILLVCCITFIMLPFPAATISEKKLCYLNEINHGLYLSGTLVWRCCIAVFRVLYIKCQRLLNDKMGATNLLALMIIGGLASMTGFSIALLSLDPYNYAKRKCYRWSDKAVDIMKSFQVVCSYRQKK